MYHALKLRRETSGTEHHTRFDMFVFDYNHFLDIVKPEDNILVPFSGGIDSAAVIYFLSKNTPAKIHTHHIVLQNREKREVPEQRAVNQVLNYINSEVRPVHKSTQSVIGLDETKWLSFDMDITGFICAQVIRAEKTFKYLASGLNYDDVGMFVNYPRADNFENILTGSLMGWFRKPPRIIRPVEKMNKREMIDALPQEFVDLTWSCRKPINKNGTYHRCGKCVSCVEFHDRDIWDRTPRTI